MSKGIPASHVQTSSCKYQVVDACSKLQRNWVSLFASKRAIWKSNETGYRYWGLFLS